MNSLISSPFPFLTSPAGLAQRIVRGDVPETLKNRKLMSLDMGALIAGAKYRGEFEVSLQLSSALVFDNTVDDTVIFANSVR